jgi:hypothetical protein
VPLVLRPADEVNNSRLILCAAAAQASRPAHATATHSLSGCQAPPLTPPLAPARPGFSRGWLAGATPGARSRPPLVHRRVFSIRI